MVGRKTIIVFFVAVLILVIVLAGFYFIFSKSGRMSTNTELTTLCKKIEIVNEIDGYSFSSNKDNLLKELDALQLWSGINLDDRFRSSDNNLFIPCNIKIIFTNKIYDDLRRHTYSNGEYIASTKVDKVEDTLFTYVGIGPEFINREPSVINNSISYIVLSDLYFRIPENRRSNRQFQRITNEELFVVSNH